MRLCVSILIVMVCSLISKGDGLNILGLFLHPGLSHQMVYNSVLTELANRGHNVSSAQHFPIKNAPPNFKLLQMNSPPNTGGSLNLHDYDKKVMLFDRINDFLLIYYNYIFKLGVNMCELFLSSPITHSIYFGAEKFDLILTESFNSDCIYALAEKLDIPVVAMQSFGLNSYIVSRFGQPDNPAYIPHYISWNSDNMSLLERLENAFIHYFNLFHHRFVLQKIEESLIFEKLGVTISLEEVAKRRTKLLLSNSYHALHRPRPLVPAIIEIGGVHLKNEYLPLNEELEKYVTDSENGVIVFSFGTLINASTISAEKLNIFQQVFSELPQNIIIKYDEDYMPNKPKNVKLVKWLPQRELLKHKNVRAFITHGGLAGVVEATEAGVPVLVLSVLGDQHFNAAAVKESGLGLTIGYKHMTLENLGQSMRQLLSPEMQASAKKVSKMWKDRPLSPMDTAIFWIEFIGRNPDAYLSSKARDLPLYSLALLDIGLIVVVVIFVLIYFIYASIRLLLLLLLKKRKSNENKIAKKD